MTEYTAQCRISSYDRIRARRDEGSVELAGYFGDYAGEAFILPDAARTFARGILALADEIDGGEAEPADTRPKVGDRLRVTKVRADATLVRVGQIITVHATDYDNEDGADYIRAFLGDKDDYAYFISLDHVEPVTEEPVPSLPAIGARFRVTKDGLNNASVKRGDRLTVSSLHADYFGTTAEDGFTWYFTPKHIGDGLEPFFGTPEFLADWERDLLGNAEPTPSLFARYVDEAKALLEGTVFRGDDVIRLAQELADRG
ncbi:hypothetical protein AB0E81_11155 [Streptomyces sp. NPDC033538]|uniref:hypothetical protein n=1 Tax=Streptomyces sp. NPDC033538 TaxID=3155367 RepID=UPI0033DF3A3C